MKKILTGSRKSPLAIAQTRLIIQAIREKFSDLEFEIVPIETHGDKNFSSGIKNTFTYEIEQALLNNKIDFAVHSLKDLSLCTNPELPVIAYYKREDPCDALILKNDFDLNALHFDKNIILGTSSLRRKMQLEKLYANALVKPLRGNINTRLNKLNDDANNYSGIILAMAGLKRLGLENHVNKIFSVDEIVPAAGQGILICQGRAGGDYFYLDAINDNNTKFCALTERKFVSAFGTGCDVPAGAFCVVVNVVAKNEWANENLLDEKMIGQKNIFKFVGYYSGIKKFLSGEFSGDLALNFDYASEIGERLAENILNENECGKY